MLVANHPTPTPTPLPPSTTTIPYLLIYIIYNIYSSVLLNQLSFLMGQSKACDGCIPTVTPPITAVHLTPPIMLTLLQVGLIASAIDVIHPNVASSIISVSMSGSSSTSVSKHTADHCSISVVPAPVIITNCSPFVIDKDFHPPFRLVEVTRP